MSADNLSSRATLAARSWVSSMSCFRLSVSSFVSASFLRPKGNHLRFFSLRSFPRLRPSGSTTSLRAVLPSGHTRRAADAPRPADAAAASKRTAAVLAARLDLWPLACPAAATPATAAPGAGAGGAREGPMKARGAAPMASSNSSTTGRTLERAAPAPGAGGGRTARNSSGCCTGPGSGAWRRTRSRWRRSVCSCPASAARERKALVQSLHSWRGRATTPRKAFIRPRIASKPQ
mmetsp:Transcript_106978/g.312862  ORF Transcript_106978/g.312862 Transcript_106978/m.312862 type:complete len:234 (-) Transcript_106978:6-707(-)